MTAKTAYQEKRAGLMLGNNYQGFATPSLFEPGGKGIAPSDPAAFDVARKATTSLPLRYDPAGLAAFRKAAGIK
jgi:hypothetical protein